MKVPLYATAVFIALYSQNPVVSYVRNTFTHTPFPLFLFANLANFFKYFTVQLGDFKKWNFTYLL